MQVSRPPNFTAVKAGLLSSLKRLLRFTCHYTGFFERAVLLSRFSHLFYIFAREIPEYRKNLSRENSKNRRWNCSGWTKKLGMEFRVEKNIWTNARIILHLLSRSLFSLCDQYLHGRKEIHACSFFLFPFFFETLVCRIETTGGDVISDLFRPEKEKQRGERRSGAVVVNASPTRRYYD